ncbi:MAG: 1-(5-phosphoribosyl)-5-[Synergistaceae bacterium]|nr:1-(5-phosphoribosyl)-5-[(5-phosphoribosylamino)methylideneamino]imidazole-4-carboxamide isomerase [Synergistaceae bacterium]MBQ6968868.1 1-(5-phosphoribosyl)-5-[(5-phosphoribosylamino)methylideneamino]imidazole-4-carboxamide isomerase [Synergistaceae bacterium]
MIILPAIDLFHGQAVRLLRGDYSKMTVYDPEPVNTAMKFKSEGAQWIHVVDLEGAKSGEAVNIDTVMRIREACGLKCEVGGGVRDMAAVERYVNSGIDRVILGTSAVNDEEFLREAVKNFAERIAVGVDIKNGNVAVKGWLEDSGVNALAFCRKMQDIGVKTLISTDISRDGAMIGTNRSLYAELSKTLSINIIASGGVSSLDDVKALSSLGLHGAIIGKAYYTGAVKISEAIEAAKS